MLNIFLLILSLLPSFLLGFAFMTFFFKNEKELTQLQKISLAFFLGTGIFTMFLFLLSLLKISWNSLGISLIFILFSLVILLKSSFYKINLSKQLSGLKQIRIKINPIKTLVVCLVIFKLFTIFYLSIDKPILNFDAWSNWSLRAKVFYYQKGIPQDPKGEFFLGGGGHINYPLQIPILQAWIYTTLGSWNDQLVKIIFPLYLVAFILFMYSFIVKTVGSVKALLFTFIFISLPFINYHTSADYADLPVGLYTGVATMLLLLFLQTKRFSFLILSSLMLGCSGWIKNEGLILLSLVLILLLVYYFQGLFGKKQAIKFMPSFFAGLIFLLPWIIYKASLGLGFSNLGSNITGLSFQSIHFQVLPVVLTGILTTSNYSLLWPAFLVSVLLTGRKSTKNINSIILLIAFYFLFLLSTYLLTDNYLYILDGTILQRNLLIIAPSIFWVVTLIWEKYFTDHV